MRHVVALVLTLLVAIVLLIGAPEARAGTVQYWSNLAPTGNVLTTRPIIVSGHTTSDGIPLQPASLKLFVDGVEIPRPMYSASVLSAYVYVYCIPRPALTDGVHAFRMEVSDAAGKLSFREWTAKVVQPPTATWVSPKAGSTVNTGRPRVEMALDDNTPGTAFTVAGQVRSGSSAGPVVAAFGGTGLSEGANSFALPSELVPGTYYLTATVTDAAGNRQTLSGATSRSFTTAVAPAMTVLESCDACHPTLREAHPAPATTDCMVCHAGYDGDHMEGTYYCDDCHYSGWHKPTGVSVRVVSSCTRCHTPSRPAVPQHTAASTASVHDSSCGGCHATSLIARHASPAGSSYTYQCDLCHGSDDITVQTAIEAGNSSCNACHTSGYHADFELKHEAPTDACLGAGCHATTVLVDAHEAYVGSTGRYPQYADTCELCHQNDNADRVPENATADCATCHPDRVEYHGYDAVKHTATLTNSAITILGTDFGTHDCSGCHSSSDLATIHDGDCGTCHPSPADSAMPYDKGCVQGDCHSATSTAPQHGEIDAAHVTSAQSCTASGCHTGGTNVASIHQAQGCSTCHSAGRTPTAVCVTCHDTDSPHGDDRAIHASNLSVGAVRMFEDHDGMGPLDYGVYCSWCHGTANLLDTHQAQDCVTCHGGPRETFTTWNKTCQQGGCHATYHQEADAGHEDAYNTTDCMTDCHNADWSVPAENCGGCHTLKDIQPPVTTSDARASYVGPASIRLGPSDPFPSSGIAQTCYTIDGGATVQGTTVYVAPPAAGSENHTLSFWSVDNAGHTEATKSVTFEIVADSTPPSTTSDARSSYVGPASIKLTATDNGFLGVKNTYYRVDGGAATAGTVVSVPQPSSGVATHTVEFWSVDWSDVEEPHKTITFTNSVDSFPPVTTVSGISEWIKFYRAWITLDAVDVGDAGVVGSYAILDGTIFLGGPSTGHLVTNSSTYYLVEGQHTLEYWSVDSVGNIESHKTTSFGVDWHGPTVTTDAQSTYTGPATIKIGASDPISGVQQMTYRLDSGAIQVGDTVTVLPPASGYANHTLQCWATDNAGNTGSKWVNFRVYAVTETTPPEGTMSVNDGATYTTSTSVTLNSVMTDAGSGMAQMRVDPGTGTYGAWTAYVASYAFALPAGDGPKTVRAEYRDVNGNVALRTDTIALDSTAPSGTMTVNGGAATTTSTAAMVNSAMSDSGSGVSRMRIDPGTGEYGSWIAYSASQAITLPEGSGAKTVNVEYEDAAGNRAIKTDTIVLGDTTDPSDTTAPTTTSDAQASYTGTATIALSPSDNDGGAGVAGTWWQLDSTSGPWTSGTSVAVPSPASGAAPHVLYWYSVDNAGNQESVKSASFTVTAPIPDTATLAFLWNGEGYAEMHVENAAGVTIASKVVEGYGSQLSWYLTVPAGQNYYLVCDYYEDWGWDDYGGGYGIWSNNPSINPDGILSPGEVVTWYY